MSSAENRFWLGQHLDFPAPAEQQLLCKLRKHIEAALTAEYDEVEVVLMEDGSIEHLPVPLEALPVVDDSPGLRAHLPDAREPERIAALNGYSTLFRSTIEERNPLRGNARQLEWVSVADFSCMRTIAAEICPDNAAEEPAEYGQALGHLVRATYALGGCREGSNEGNRELAAAVVTLAGQMAPFAFFLPMVEDSKKTADLRLKTRVLPVYEVVVAKGWSAWARPASGAHRFQSNAPPKVAEGYATPLFALLESIAYGRDKWVHDLSWLAQPQGRGGVVANGQLALATGQRWPLASVRGEGEESLFVAAETTPIAHPWWQYFGDGRAETASAALRFGEHLPFVSYDDYELLLTQRLTAYLDALHGVAFDKSTEAQASAYKLFVDDPFAIYFDPQPRLCQGDDAGATASPGTFHEHGNALAIPDALREEYLRTFGAMTSPWVSGAPRLAFAVSQASTVRVLAWDRWLENQAGERGKYALFELLPERQPPVRRLDWYR